MQSVEEEDCTPFLRERLRLVKERTSLTNYIKGLPTLHGIFYLAPRAKAFVAHPADVLKA